MAFVLADRVKETTTTAGTGTVTLLGASTGYQSFSAIGNGNTTYYTIASQTGSEWEVGIGTYTSSGTTLARTTVISSSNAGSLVNFSAGTKDVFVTYPAEFTSNAIGGGIGAGAKGVSAYGDYRAEAVKGPTETRRSAIDEATEYENTGPISRGDQLSIPLPGEGGGADTGIAGTPDGGMGGAGSDTGRTEGGAEVLDNQLGELKAKEQELTAGLAEAQAYIREMAEVDPNDDRIASATEYIGNLNAELQAVKQAQQEIAPDMEQLRSFFPLMEKNFGYGFTGLHNGLYNNTVDPLKMSRYGIESAMKNHNHTTIINRINSAITNNELIVFYAHKLPSAYLNEDGTSYVTESDLRFLLDYLKTKTDDNLCQVLSCDEAIYQYYKDPFA